MKTGTNFSLNGVPCIGLFQLEKNSQDNAVACSDSDGAEVLADSNKDWKAQVRAFGHTPLVLPNDLLTFAAVDSDDEGWQSAASGAIVRSAHIFCRSQQSEMYYHDLIIEGNGSLTKGTYSQDAVVVPSPSSSIVRDIKIGGDSVAGLGDWDLLLEAKTAKPIWLAGDSGWPKRAAGPLSATLTFDQYLDDLDDMPALQTDAIYKAYCTSTTFWELEWMRVLARPVKVVVRGEDNAPEATVFRSVARWNSTVGGVKGYIKKPDGTQWWPSE
jgi:hypothetical protein